MKQKVDASVTNVRAECPANRNNTGKGILVSGRAFDPAELNDEFAADEFAADEFAALLPSV